MKSYLCFAYPGLLSPCSSVVYTRTLHRHMTKPVSGYATLPATFIIKQALSINLLFGCIPIFFLNPYLCISASVFCTYIIINIDGVFPVLVWVSVYP